MGLTVETGQGIPDANSYATVATVDAYFADRSNAQWATAVQGDKEAALIRATQGLDNRYRGLWIGTKATKGQALAWPRVDKTTSTGLLIDPDGFEIPADELPQELVMACAEVALIELTERFIQHKVTRDDAVKSDSTGPLSTTYKDTAPSVPHYPHIDALLRNLAAVGTEVIGVSIGLTDDERREMNHVNIDDYFIQG